MGVLNNRHKKMPLGNQNVGFFSCIILLVGKQVTKPSRIGISMLALRLPLKQPDQEAMHSS